MRTSKEEFFTVIIPDEGKKIRNKFSGSVAEYIVYLGKGDKVENYEEVDDGEVSL